MLKSDCFDYQNIQYNYLSCFKTHFRITWSEFSEILASKLVNHYLIFTICTSLLAFLDSVIKNEQILVYDLSMCDMNTPTRRYLYITNALKVTILILGYRLAYEADFFSGLRAICFHFLYLYFLLEFHQIVPYLVS